MTRTCSCSDRTTICLVHAPRPVRITISDVLAGCQCSVIAADPVGGWPEHDLVTVCVTCPVHGAPAFR